MPETKNIRIELQTVTRKPHWFLDRLKWMDFISVVFVVLVTFSGIYFRLGVWLPTALLFCGVGVYFYLIKYSKNYVAEQVISMDESGIVYNNEQHTWDDLQLLKIQYKAYKGYVEWPYKQVVTNSVEFESSKHSFIIDYPALQELKKLAKDLEKVDLINIKTKKS